MNTVTIEAITQARSATIDAANAAERAAAGHADQRCRLAALLVAFELPGAGSLVFTRDEDLLTAETIITLVSIRDSAGTLLWYNPETGFANSQDAVALGKPPDLAPDHVSHVESQIQAAYDSHAGHFDTTSEGHDLMPGVNLLVLPFPAADSAGDRSELGDTAAIEVIAEWLRDPEWGAGMLEDIADTIRRTGRSVEDYPDGRATWPRH